MVVCSLRVANNDNRTVRATRTPPRALLHDPPMARSLRSAFVLADGGLGRAQARGGGIGRAVGGVFSTQEVLHRLDYFSGAPRDTRPR